MPAMNPFFQSLLAAFGLSSPSPPAVATAAEFTQEFVALLRDARPQIRIEVVQDLELRVAGGAGEDATCFLNNAFDLYRQSPADKPSILHHFVASSLETIDGLLEQFDRSRIVPVIKDRGWLAEMQAAARATGSTQPCKQVWEEYNRELVVVYAQDSPANIRYLTPGDLDEHALRREELRDVAIENLRRLLPPIECRGGEGLYMLAAGGNYESSLLLFDGLWDNEALALRGAPVVAIPTRDLLLVTGSHDPVNLARLKEMAGVALSSGAYHLTSHLFLRTGGRFEVYDAQGN